MNNSQALIYHITSDSHILLNKQLIYKEQTIQQWDVQIRKDDKQGWYMSIVVAELPQTDQPASKPLHGLLELINKPTNRLELLFDDHWYLQQIVNKTAILSCWKDIRKAIVDKIGDSKEAEEMIKERDGILADLEVELPNSLGHFILFTAFGKNRKVRFCTPSILSSEGEVDISLSARESEGTNHQLIYAGEGDLTPLSALRKAYHEQIKPYAADAAFAYHYGMQSDYRFNRNDGMLQKAVANITEQASAQYIYHHSLVFERQQTISTTNQPSL